MKTTLKPVGNRVLIDLDEVTQTSGGLYVPQTADTGPKTGTVIDVGELYSSGGLEMYPAVKPGDKVIVDDLGATHVKINYKDYIVVRNEDIIGILSEIK